MSLPGTTPDPSSPPRRPTGDPARYLVPAEHLSPGHAARLELAEADPVPARPAATVVLVRPAGRPAGAAEERRGGEDAADPASRRSPVVGPPEPVPVLDDRRPTTDDRRRHPPPGGLEVLLLRRPRVGFAAGAWVFPGGTLDPDDHRFPAKDPGEPRSWATRLGVEEPARAWAFVVAAIRETWEETGILIGSARAGDLARRQARTRLVEGTLSFSAAAEQVGFAPDTGALTYIARWITPAAEPRRYDTRFFLADVTSEEVTLEGAELVEHRWFAPAEAVALYERDELSLLPPTAHTLRRLSEARSVPDLIRDLRSAPAPSFFPRMRPHPDGIIIDIVELERD